MHASAHINIAISDMRAFYFLLRAKHRITVSWWAKFHDADGAAAMEEGDGFVLSRD